MTLTVSRHYMTTRYFRTVRADIDMFLTLAIRKESGRLVVVNGDGHLAEESPAGCSLKFDRREPFKLKPASADSAVDIIILDSSHSIPSPRIQSMLTGTQEAFRVDLGFTDPDYAPTTTTLALWLEYKSGAPRSHEFLAGGKLILIRLDYVQHFAGPPIEIMFKMNVFHGNDGKTAGNAESVVTARETPNNIQFRAGSNVSDWELMEVRFRDSLSSPGATIEWGEGNAIYTRWRVEAGESNDPQHPEANPILALEGLVVKEGSRLDSLPPESKRLLKSGSSLTFLIWRTKAAWRLPSSRCHLVTTPGIYVVDDEVFTAPTEHSMRWQLQSVLELSRRGDYMTDTMNWDEYIQSPISMGPRVLVPYCFVVPVSQEPNFSRPSGMCPLPHASMPGTDGSRKSVLVIRHGKRDGFRLDLSKRKAGNSRARTKLPVNSAPPKYSSIPHPLLELDRQALPTEASQEEVARAVANFSGSIARDTQAGFLLI